MELEIRKYYHDYEQTKTQSITYHKKGTNLWHREDGPAVIRYCRNGKISFHSYWVNDECHREDGPAKIWYNEDGTIIKQEYWINGEILTEKEFNQRTK